MFLPDSGIENLTKLKSLKTFILWESSEIKVVEITEVLSKLPLLATLCRLKMPIRPITRITSETITSIRENPLTLACMCQAFDNRHNFDLKNIVLSLKIYNLYRMCRQIILTYKLVTI